MTGRSGVRAAQGAALLAGALALTVTLAEIPLAGLARQSVLASGGSLPFPFTLAYGVVGLLLAWRKPGNLIGWLMLAAAAVGAASESASFYLVADYRLRGGQLPLGWLAVLAQPGWAPCIVALGLIVLLFPDGRLPGRRWRWFVGVYLAFGAVWLAAVAGQVASYRRSAGERREQLKWLLAGAVGSVGGLFMAFASSGTHGLLGAVLGLVSWTGLLGLPVCIGVAVLKYRLFDIDRLISRTLAAAALFNPVRVRVQRLVDRRFNRARYDAEQMVAAFAASLKDAVDLDVVQAGLASTVRAALEPAQLSVWIRGGAG